MALQIAPYLQEVLDRKILEINSMPDEFDEEPIGADYRGSTILDALQMKPSGKVHLIPEFLPKGSIVRELGLKEAVSAIGKNNKQAGVCAVSLMVDEYFSGGKGNCEYGDATLSNMLRVRKGTNLPVMISDFITDQRQILWAKHVGAQGVLLVAQILEVEQIRDFMDVADGLRLDVLVEVTNEAELQRALEAGARIIVINNLDWVDHTTDFRHTLRLTPEIPAENIIISASGFKSQQDVQMILERTSGRVQGILASSILMATRSRAELLRTARSLSRAGDEITW